MSVFFARTAAYQTGTAAPSNANDGLDPAGWPAGTCTYDAATKTLHAGTAGAFAHASAGMFVYVKAGTGLSSPLLTTFATVVDGVTVALTDALTVSAGPTDAASTAFFDVAAAEYNPDSLHLIKAGVGTGTQVGDLVRVVSGQNVTAQIATIDQIVGANEVSLMGSGDGGSILDANPGPTNVTATPFFNVTGAVWNHTAKTLTKTGIGANVVVGDYVDFTAGTHVTPQVQAITVVAANVLTFTDDITDDGSDPTNVAAICGFSFSTGELGDWATRTISGAAVGTALTRYLDATPVRVNLTGGTGVKTGIYAAVTGDHGPPLTVTSPMGPANLAATCGFTASGITINASTGALTKTGIFTGYSAAQAPRINITGGTGVATGVRTVTVTDSAHGTLSASPVAHWPADLTLATGPKLTFAGGMAATGNSAGDEVRLCNDGTFTAAATVAPAKSGSAGAQSRMVAADTHGVPSTTRVTITPTSAYAGHAALLDLSAQPVTNWTLENLYFNCAAVGGGTVPDGVVLGVGCTMFGCAVTSAYITGITAPDSCHIVNCVVKGAGGTGIDLLGVNGYQHVIGCSSYSNGGTGILAETNSDNCIIADCVSFANGGDGIALLDAEAVNASILNNTCYGNIRDGLSFYLLSGGLGGKGGVIANNITQGNGRFGHFYGAAVVSTFGLIGYNLSYGNTSANSDKTDGLLLGNGNTYGQAQFRNPGGGDGADFRLTSVNAGAAGAGRSPGGLSSAIVPDTIGPLAGRGATLRGRGRDPDFQNPKTGA